MYMFSALGGSFSVWVAFLKDVLPRAILCISFWQPSSLCSLLKVPKRIQNECSCWALSVAFLGVCFLFAASGSSSSV